MTWRLRQKAAEHWNTLRKARREDLRNQFDLIDAGGCGTAGGVVPHPRAPGLFVCMHDRYLVTFKCSPMVIWQIEAKEARLRGLNPALLA
jgi:hypothetical protein